MKTVLKLACNDLKRDWKQPWTTLLFIALPLCMSLLIAGIFGGSGGKGPAVTLHVAVLDQDKDLLAGFLRSLPTQGEAASRLRLHFVDTREEGLRLVEKRKASALVVLPRGMTEGLLNGTTNTIDLYENPAEQVLPRIVRQGTSLAALGLSGAAELLGEPLRDLRQMIQSNSLPAETSVTGLASASFRRISGLRTYLFPPLIQIRTVSAANFIPATTSPPPGARTP